MSEFRITQETAPAGHEYEKVYKVAHHLCATAPYPTPTEKTFDSRREAFDNAMMRAAKGSVLLQGRAVDVIDTTGPNGVRRWTVTAKEQ